MVAIAEPVSGLWWFFLGGPMATQNVEKFYTPLWIAIFIYQVSVF